jgi:hypothetical protein
MKSSPQSRPKPIHEIQFNEATSAAQPAQSESKQESKIVTPSQAESLLAAEKRTLEMMANGASLPEVLNDQRNHREGTPRQDDAKNEGQLLGRLGDYGCTSRPRTCAESPMRLYEAL